MRVNWTNVVLTTVLGCFFLVALFFSTVACGVGMPA